MTDAQLAKSQARTIKGLLFQLRLAKKTIAAFGDAYIKQRMGHSPDWNVVVNLYNKCEDEMDLDDLE